MAESREGESQVGYLLEGLQTYEAPVSGKAKLAGAGRRKARAHIAASAAHGLVAEKTGRQNVRTGLRVIT